MRGIPMNENKPVRHKNIRLKDYDYSQEGYYFITICTTNRRKFLCEINHLGITSEKAQYTMALTESGHVVDKHINNINSIYSNVLTDCYVIMPNHIHLIVVINSVATLTLPRIINSFKTITTKSIGFSMWQKNYYEHIIRSEEELQEVRNYIVNNPLKWHEDKYYTE